MEIKEALGPDVDLHTFLTRHIKELHKSRLEDFRANVEGAVIVSLYLEDIDERWTAEFHADGMEIENDEMVDFPMLTLIGKASDWPLIRDRSIRLLEFVESRREELNGRFRFDETFRSAFEKYDGTIHADFVEDQSVKVTFVLNDYDLNPDARSFAVEIDVSLLEEVARGTQSITQAARGLSIKGDVRFASLLGGFFVTQAERFQ